MKKIVLAMAIAIMTLVPVVAFAHPGGPGSPVGPPGGVFYANDVAYESAVTPAHVPDKGPFDAFYVFPDCTTGCFPVSDAAPGFGKYNGGRWAVIQAFGITTQLTNSDDVQSMATSLVDTGHRFVCPLIKIH
ncbi:MAG: hypothetical protein BZY88_15890 [SAR202 cluster bacterium Io17-Chloro-G9]|nr:MAG: hypothetical protein BZY88_15890 [SAR202 cluster bacterium Io17-Chloro-G9]